MKKFLRVLPYIILAILAIIIASSITILINNLFHIDSDMFVGIFCFIMWPIFIFGSLYLSSPNRKPFYFDSRLRQLHECISTIFDDINHKTSYQYSYELRCYEKHVLKYINENRSVLKNSKLPCLDQAKLLIKEQSEIYSKNTGTQLVLYAIKPYCEIKSTELKASIDWQELHQAIIDSPNYPD